MYPFDNAIQWWLKGRYGHLVAAMERHPHLLDGDRGNQLRKRLKRIKRWLVARLVLMVFLSAGLIATLLSFLLRQLPSMGDLEAALELFSTIGTTGSTLFGVGYLLATRTLAQLEIDAIMLFHLQHHHKA